MTKLTSEPLTGLRYLGGKKRGVGDWIASHLPASDVYVEPFAGMLGVMLKRTPSRMEVANDMDGNLINWWQQVRDNNDALCERLAWTPRSEQEFAEVRDAYPWEGKDDVWKAWAYTIILCHGYGGQTNIAKTHFGKKYDGGDVLNASLLAQLRALRDRMVDVQLWHMDAVELLEKFEENTGALIYCDPPYPSTQQANKNYEAHEELGENFTLSLKAQQGKVAISGFPGEWDHLGWECETMERISSLGSAPAARTECLWTNFEVTSRLFGLD